MTSSSNGSKTLVYGDEKRIMVREMFDNVAPRYDALNRLISLGLDVSWRKKTVNALGLPPGSVILDLACGTGDLSQLLAQRQMRPIGIDLSLGMLQHDHSEVPLVLGDALALPLSTGSVDGAVCGFALRNFTDIPPVAEELSRVVRPGGRIAILDAAKPTSGIARAGYNIWFGHAVPAVGSLFSDSAAYRYLPDSVEYLPAPERMRSIFRNAGFASVGRRTFLAGSAQLITATRAGVPS